MAAVDIFATKGIEYILCTAYLLILIPVWLFLNRSQARAVPTPALRPERTRPLPGRWFAVPEGLLFHQGHAWARPEGAGILRVGLDDFAQSLVGTPAAIRLPEVGTSLEQGVPAWQLSVNSHSVDMLSPVGGDVVELNPLALRSPRLVSDDPYGEGWLMRVRVPNEEAAARNLLSGRLARAWMDEVEESLRSRMGSAVGVALQDGGTPMPGFVRQLDPERWHELAAELLLTTP